MVKSARDAMQDGDCVLLVADAGKEISQVERDVISYLETSGVPCVLALNKVDLYRRILDQRRGKQLQRHQLGDHYLCGGHDGDGGGDGKGRVFPVAVPHHRQGGEI